MPSPEGSTEPEDPHLAELEREAAIRRAVAELKDKLTRRSVTLRDVLMSADNDAILGGLEVSMLLEAIPGVGEVRAHEILRRLEIDPATPLRDVDDRQRKALQIELSAG